MNDKQKIREARSALLERLKSRAFNPKEDEIQHVLRRSLAPREVKMLVDSIAKLNQTMKDWQE